ncbi:MAG TPA: SpoIIE family protein phosphatase [Ilumatobacteraceae bacterium]|nr:SpoIIE family protein phosphatase [Ilumatobacteraceae bacterium]
MPAAIDPGAVLAAATSHAQTGVVVLDGSLRFVFVNAVTAAINGRSADDHVGRSLVEVVGDTGAQLVPMLEEILATGTPVVGLDVVGEPPARPGETGVWAGSYLPYRLPGGDDGILVVFTDVTEARRAERRVRQVIDGLFAFVGLCSVDGTLLEANEFAVAATGLAEADLVGRPFWDGYWWSYDPEVQDMVRTAVNRAANGDASRFDISARVVGDRLIPIDFQVVPIMEDGVVTALVTSAIDITARTEQVENLAALSSLSADLHVALGMSELVDLVVDRAPGIFGSTIVTLGIVDDDVIHVTGSADLDGELMERWTELPFDGIGTPFHDVIATGETVWVRTREERQAWYPEMTDDSDRAGLVTTVSAPLVDDSGVIGVLGFGWDHEVAGDPTLELHVGLLAGACAQALHRVIRLKTTTDLVSQLTTQLLARRDIVEHLDVATAYVPAVSELGFGGDWYDVVTSGQSTTSLIVGDVVGHDVDAAARMAITRSALRTAVLAHPDLDGVGDLLTRSLGLTSPQFFATAVVVDVDVERRRLRWTSFGHPPAMVRQVDGAVTVLTKTGPPIGLRADGAPIGSLAVESGAVVVVYSDGLVENRSEGIDDRLAELAEVLRTVDPGTGAEAILRTVMSSLVDGVPDDDVAAIVAVVP